ncbi:transposase [Thermophagus sp. OGC60D27]|uniref:transposase n=1 Tax=Thermophagus sp. OGC60D27 TaxID=3458415 RepID=UPI0040381F28
MNKLFENFLGLLILANGDTRKQQLWGRSRYPLFKPEERWRLAQWHRAQIFFKRYSDIEKAFNLYSIDNCKIRPDISRTKLAHWFNDIENSGFNAFITVRSTNENHHDTINNYIHSRCTNATAVCVIQCKNKGLQKTVQRGGIVKFFL